MTYKPSESLSFLPLECYNIVIESIKIRSYSEKRYQGGIDIVKSTYIVFSVLSGIKQVNVELEPGFQTAQNRDNSE